MIVATVLKTGGPYDARYVRRLAAGVAKYVSDASFVCFTNDVASVSTAVPGIHLRKLRHEWPGWWAKMEVFSLEGPVLYLDLDTVIVGNIDGLLTAIAALKREQLMMLRGFYKKDSCSGIMGWSTDMSYLYKTFQDISNKKKFVPATLGWSLYTGGEKYKGDQDWIRSQVQDPVMCQDLFDGVVSYKVDVRARNSPPPGSSIVCFHGKPRPHELTGQEWLKSWEAA